jgi:hypothetical protein
MIIIIVITITITITIIIIITDFNKSDIMFIDVENKTAVVNITVPLNYNPSNTETEKITKYENLVLEIKNICERNNLYLYPSVISAEGVVSKNLLKYLENIGLTKNILRMGQKAVPLQTCHIVCKFLEHAP